MSDKRGSGVLLHISSLPGKYSIGSFGENALKFINFLSECGFSYWQVLPFGVTDGYNSPYNSYSAFGGNPYFIDLDILKERGLLTEAELNDASQNTPYVCEYKRLFDERLPLLFKAASRQKDNSEVNKFLDSHPEIEKFCEFMALKSANGNSHWMEWENEKTDEYVLNGWKFIQYEFYRQWQEVRKYAALKNIKIIGDIPFYVSYDSCDVKSNKKMFMLGEDDRPTLVAGVPPDYFCKEGQLWGNPLYDWEAMKKDGYSWWRKRISYMSELFDGIRVDHFRAAESFWAVDGKEKTAINGKWKKGPGMELVNVIKSAAGKSFVIAEDLGDISDDVRELVKESGFPGMRVFQFGFDGDGDSLHKPHNYPANCVAYSGTHDNNTLLGYLWELDENKRKDMLEYCGYTNPDWGGGCLAIIREIFASHADRVIFPLQDILGYGSDTRLNRPGSAEGNWEYRVTNEQLSGIDKGRFVRLNRLFNR